MLLLQIASGSRLLIGIGLLALGGFASHAYYQLEHTLLVKSMVLAATAMLLLAGRLALQLWLPSTNAGEHHAA